MTDYQRFSDLQGRRRKCEWTAPKGLRAATVADSMSTTGGMAPCSKSEEENTCKGITRQSVLVLSLKGCRWCFIYFYLCSTRLHTENTDCRLLNQREIRSRPCMTHTHINKSQPEREHHHHSFFPLPWLFNRRSRWPSPRAS